MSSEYTKAKTFNKSLQNVWQLEPDKTAMIYESDTGRTALTNSQVRELSHRCAYYFQLHGVRRGDVVANTLQNSLEREIVNFGILMAGGVVLHADAITSRGKSFWVPIVQAETKFMVVAPDAHSPAWRMVRDDVGTSPAAVERLTKTTAARGVSKVFKLYQGCRQPKDDPNKPPSCIELLTQQQGRVNEYVSAHEPASIVVSRQAGDRHYSMIMRTQGELLAMGKRMDEMLGVKRSDVIYTDFPLAWVPGPLWHYTTLGTTIVRSTLIDCQPRKVVAETWSLLQKEGVTMAALETEMIIMLSSFCEDLEPTRPRLRMVTCPGRRPVTKPVIAALDEFADTLSVCYSKIEAGLISRELVTQENKDYFADGCVGFMMLEKDNSGCSKAISKSHVDTTGEIILDGALVAKRYLKDPALTRSKFTPDGFLLTGDIGFYNEDGKLFVLGRKSDCIVRAGMPIFPEAIEGKINNGPGIWKVKVVSVKDEQGMIQMCACVIPRQDDTLTIEAVKEYCRYQLGGTSESEDAPPEMPSYIFFFDSFPMSGNQVNRGMLGFMAAEIIRGNARIIV